MSFAGFEVFSELRRGAINGIHHAFDPFHLFDPLLKLPIQYTRRSVTTMTESKMRSVSVGVAVQVCEQVR